jgi:nanoRNase/pAp phosphatase (c-di-AMP/oligoRNAs hydrolase)
MFKCLRKKGIRHGLVFKHQPDGNWVLSMYNINDNDNFHCGDFLRAKYNGGGHKGAAGCTLDEKTFIKILKNKRI